MKLRKIHWYALQALVIGVLSFAFAISSAFAFGPQSSNKNGYGGSISLKSLTGFKIGKYQRPDTGIRAAMISESR